MRKVKRIVHECFTGGKNPEDVFTAVFLSSTTALTENADFGIMKTTEQPQDSLCSRKGSII